MFYLGKQVVLPSMKESILFVKRATIQYSRARGLTRHDSNKFIILIVGVHAACGVQPKLSVSILNELAQGKF